MALPTALQDREQQKFVDVAPGETAVRVSGDNFSGSFTTSGLRTGGRITEVVLNDSSWTALPATPLSGRNAIAIQNFSGQTIKLNYDNAVSGLTGVYLQNTLDRFYDISDTIIIYAKSSSGAATIIVEEIA